MMCIQQGNISAFEELYNRYSRRLLTYFFRALGGDSEKAQDFLQETFLKVIEKPNLFRPQSTFSTWIFTVADNLCKNEYRRLHVRRIVERNIDIDSIALNPEDEYLSAGDGVDQETFECILYKELETINPGHRSAFLLRYQQNLSIKEISKILECSEGTVKSRLFYTVRKLAARLKDFNPCNTEVCKNEQMQ